MNEPALPLDQSHDLAMQPSMLAAAGYQAVAQDEAGLLQRIDVLCQRYAYVLEETPAALVREAVALERAGLASAAYFVSAAVLAAACSDCGPALAFGPWASSTVLAALGGSLGGAPQMTAIPGGADPAAWFTECAQLPSRELPVLLLTSAPDAAFMDELAESLQDFDIRLERESEVISSLVATHKALPTEESARGGLGEQLFAIPGSPDELARIRVIESRLWRALVCARAAEVDMCDAPWSTVGDRSNDQAPGRLLASPWLRLLPELPPADVMVSTPDAMVESWLTSAVMEITNTPATALAVRARVVWELASITARCPVAGYLGLLEVTNAESLTDLINAAVGADVDLDRPGDPCLPCRWRLVEQGGAYAIGYVPQEATALGNSASAPTTSRSIVIDDRSLVLEQVNSKDQTQVALLHADARAGHREAAGGNRLEGDTAVVEVDHEGWHVALDRHLLALAPHVVEVLVQLTGDRVADRQRIAEVQARLDRFSGPIKARLILSHANFKRAVDRDLDKGVIYGPALKSSMCELLGPGAITLRPDVTSGAP